MKKCLIYGNCQTEYIENSLIENPDFSNIYSEIFSKKVHQIKQKDIPELETIISEIDLFIYQPVSDNYRKMTSLGTDYLKSRIKSDCIVISFPVAYFTGYHPEMIYLKPIDNQPIKGDVYNYHDFNILSGFYQGQTTKDLIAKIFNESFYSPYYIKKNFDLTISELEKREASLDIKISQFIRNNYQFINLFNTINHPHHPIIGYIINCVLEILGLDHQYSKSDFINGEHIIEYNNYFPIYPSVKKILNLQFENKLIYQIQNTSYSVYDALKKLYKFYDNNQDLVEFNVEAKWEQFSRNSNKFSLPKTGKPSSTDAELIIELNQLNLDIPLDIATVIKELSELCDRLIQQEQFSEAIIISKSILELKPKNIRYWQKLAKLYEMNQNFEEAIDCYKQVLNINSEHTNTYINLGRIYYKVKCFAKAIEYYNGGISLNPQQPSWVYRFLGNCLQELGYLEDAIAKYTQALSLPSFPPMTYIELGNALKKQHRNKEAEQAYQKAVELNPQLSNMVDYLEVSTN